MRSARLCPEGCLWIVCMVCSTIRHEMQSKARQIWLEGLGRGVLGALLGMSWGDGLRLVHLALSVCAIIQAGGEGWQVMLALVVNLLCAWTRFMRCGVYARLERLFAREENDKDNIKNYSTMETKTTMDAEMMKGLFGGANFNGEVQIVVAPREKVVFKEVQMKGEERRQEQPKATDEQVANALMAINGKGKPLSSYQTWLGACVLLWSKYDFPRNLNDCCQRINALPIQGVEYECKYENVRKLLGTNKFVKEDIDGWDSYKPRDEERKLFNECLQVSKALDAEIKKQMQMEIG